MISILLDIIFITYFDIYTFFYLNILYSKNICYVVLTSLIIDFFISYTYGTITLINIILYIINSKISNYYLKGSIDFALTIVSLEILSAGYIPNIIFSFLLQLIYIYLNKNHNFKW